MFLQKFRNQNTQIEKKEDKKDQERQGSHAACSAISAVGYTELGRLIRFPFIGIDPLGFISYGQAGLTTIVTDCHCAYSAYCSQMHIVHVSHLLSLGDFDPCISKSAI